MIESKINVILPALYCILLFPGSIIFKAKLYFHKQYKVKKIILKRAKVIEFLGKIIYNDRIMGITWAKKKLMVNRFEEIIE